LQEISCNDKEKWGERGSPCLTPLLQWIVLPGTPLKRTEDVPEEKMSFIHFIQLGPKPLCSMIEIIA